MASTFRRFAGDCTQPLVLPPSFTGNMLLWRLLAAQKYRMLAGMTAGVVWMGTSALVPVALGRVFDGGIAKQSSATFALWVGVVGALYAVQVVSWPVRHRLAMGIFERSLRWGHELVAARVLDPRGGFDAAYTSGEITSFITTDTRRVASMTDVCCRGAGSIVTFTGVLIAMLVINTKLAAIILLGLLPLLLLLTRLMHHLEARNHEQNRKLSDASALAGDFIGALRVIKGVGAEQVAITRYSSRTQSIVDAALASARVRSQTLALDLVMPGVIMTVVGWYGAHLVSNSELTVGQLVMFSGWSIFLVVPLLTFSEMGRKYAAARAGARRLAVALNVPHLFFDSGSAAVETLDSSGDLTIDDLTIASGTFVTIIASPAQTAGLLSALRGERISDVPSHHVAVDGVSIDAVCLDALRAHVLVAEHDAVLFSGTLRENLAAARADATEDEMLAALTVASAMDIVESLRDGLDGIVAERGRSLSGGQRQRVALARALLADAPVLILVDPTSALDSFTESEIVDRIRNARRGRTTVVFTSSAALQDISDRVVVWDETKPREAAR